MISEYLVALGSITNNTGDITDQTAIWDRVLSHSESVLTVIVDLLVAVAGVFGIRYLYNIKSKRLNATFSYYSRLKVRLYLMRKIVENNKDAFLNKLIPENIRHDLGLENASVINHDMGILVDTANETLKFLKTEEDQFPASEDWIICHNNLLDFLYDCSKMSDPKFYKWKTDYQVKQQEYYSIHLSNLEKMIDDISKQQIKLNDKLFKTHLISRIKQKIRKRDKK